MPTGFSNFVVELSTVGQLGPAKTYPGIETSVVLTWLLRSFTLLWSNEPKWRIPAPETVEAASHLNLVTNAIHLLANDGCTSHFSKDILAPPFPREREPEFCLCCQGFRLGTARCDDALWRINALVGILERGAHN